MILNCRVAIQNSYIMTFLSALPFELIQELFCHFNHSTTISVLNSLQFTLEKSDKIWRYKILNELKYDKSYFEHTIIPLDQKYLELKTNHSVDYGSEAFTERFQIMEHIGLLPDTPETTKLLDYFIEKYNEFMPDFIQSLLESALISRNQTILNRCKNELYISLKYFEELDYYCNFVAICIAFNHTELIDHIKLQMLNDSELAQEYHQMEMLACCINGNINQLITLYNKSPLSDYYRYIVSELAFKYKNREIIEFLISKSYIDYTALLLVNRAFTDPFYAPYLDKLDATDCRLELLTDYSQSTIALEWYWIMIKREDLAGN